MTSMNRNSTPGTAKLAPLARCLVLALLGTAALGHAASAPEDLRAERHYRVELIVFARQNVTEANTTEVLTRTEVSPQPANIASLRGDLDAYPFELDDLTRRMLARDRVRPPAPDTRLTELWGIPETASGSADAPAAEPAPAGPEDPAAQSAREQAALQEALAQALRADAQQLAADSYRFDPSRLAQLSDVQARLRRRYEILVAGSWQQPVPARDAPQPLLLQTGQRFGDLFQLEGFVEVTISRYLHVRTNLKYFEPELGAYLVAADPMLAESVQAEIAAQDAADAEAAASTPVSGDPASQEPAAVFERVVPEGDHFMELAQQRRMRSAELHYLDHPKFGVLVRIDPVPASPELAAAWSALQAFERSQ